MNTNIKTVTVEYTFKTIFEYSVALIIFMFFGIFALADVGPESSLWIKVFKSLSAFPYVIAILMSIYIIKNDIKYDIDKDDATAFFAMIGMCIVLLVVSLSWNIKHWNVPSAVNKIASMTGLIFYLYLNTIPSDKTE
jgi:uncharacterized membrane protein